MYSLYWIDIYKNEICLRAQSVYRLGYELDGQGSISDRGNDGDISLRLCVQTGSGAHPASYLMGVGILFPPE